MFTQPQPPRPLVLIVDDEPINVNILVEALEPEFEIVTASAGAQALAKAKQHHPSVILLDIMMPGMNGYQICRQLRESAWGQGCKILLVSARAMMEERLEGYQAGADDYITKPFDVEELLAKVRVFARLHQAEKELRLLNEQLEEKVCIRSQQLVEAERLALLGRHTAGIVHNLNNPLTGILGFAELIARHYPEDQRPRYLLDAARQMREICSTILKSSVAANDPVQTRVEINDVLQEQINLLRSDNFFKKQIALQTAYGPGMVVLGTRHHFSQVFANLLKNARDAMWNAERKQLCVTTRGEGEWAEIEIADSGCGIAQEQEEKVFDSFFTTKPVTAENGAPTGTGLGLATCRELIKSYGGSIEIRSVLGSGAAVRVRLPRYRTGSDVTAQQTNTAPVDAETVQTTR